ncbi:MAG: hypothetical protein IT372_38460 [Polyangiaceae bacterium]|nr:hypothetical protein [Polyangiaceae bacterium]
MRNSLRSTHFLGALALGAAAALSIALVSSSATSAAAPAKDAPARVEGASKFDKDQYLVEIKPTGTYSAAKEGKLEISIEAKGEFHINDKYPLKFKVAEPAPEGVTFAKSVLKRDDGKFEEKKGTLPLAFTAAKAGTVKIAGTLSFGVCTAASCVMEKVDLELDVEVK